jgi:hypothetical protein
MEFEGLQPFKARFPNSSIERDEEQFDLHNDAVLREFNVDYQHHIVRLTWAFKDPLWTLPRAAELSQRKTTAGLTLIFSGVSKLSVAGLWLDSANDANGLDFFEYSELSVSSGETRFVMDNDAEATILASKCQLRSLGAS